MKRNQQAEFHAYFKANLHASLANRHSLPSWLIEEIRTVALREGMAGKDIPSYLIGRREEILTYLRHHPTLEPELVERAHTKIIDLQRAVILLRQYKQDRWSDLLKITLYDKVPA